MSGTSDREAYRRWLAAFGFTARDWARIKSNALAVTANYSPAALADLDARWRVGACLPKDVSRFSGRYIGLYKGRALIAWPKPYDGVTGNPERDLPLEGAPAPPRRAA